jgi:hypothetical protein
MGMIRELVVVFPEGHKLRWMLDRMLVHVAMIWQREVMNMQGLGKIHLFVEFYGDGEGKMGVAAYKKDVKILQNIMVRLHSIAEYGAEMKKIIVRKIE